MSIIKAVERAYSLLQERNWDTIYWAIDLHGTCIKSNYVSGEYEWINEDALKCLQLISNLKETKIIIWSSLYRSEKFKIWVWLSEQGIEILNFNSNDSIKNTETGCFDTKFYFSILLDDKAGFDPDTDWKLIYKYLKTKNKINNGNI